MLMLRPAIHSILTANLEHEEGGIMKFEGRKILITGATSGVGNALLNAFVGEGAHVIAVARPSARLVEADGIGSNRWRTRAS